ncbi:hypothetical protein ThvES_00013480 [Thiovulum sp. ES]|nr:hypothetical protein ThvES_00013480 [Thiovulum sp. ES]
MSSKKKSLLKRDDEVSKERFRDFQKDLSELVVLKDLLPQNSRMSFSFEIDYSEKLELVQEDPVSVFSYKLKPVKDTFNSQYISGFEDDLYYSITNGRDLLLGDRLYSLNSVNFFAVQVEQAIEEGLSEMKSNYNISIIPEFSVLVTDPTDLRNLKLSLKLQISAR